MATLKAYALTTVQRVADFLGLGTIVANSTEETVLINLINQLTEFIENYISARIHKTTYTQELYDGSGTDTLLLRQFPVVASPAVAIEVRTSAINEDDWQTEDTENYYVESANGIVHMIPGRVFIKGYQKYRVTYTAGYDYDNTTTFLSDTEGADLEYVAWKMVATAWNQRKGSLGIQSESIGDYRVVYAKTAFESPEIKEVLDKYKRIEAASYLTPSHT